MPFRAWLVCLLISAPLLRGQNAQLDSSKALFTVLAALNAAGYDDGLESPSTHPIRKAVRAEIAKLKPPSVLDIKDFLRQHRQDSPTQELRQYISYALLVTDPPEFAWRGKEYQLPPDVTTLRDFGPILARFYQEAKIDELWQRAQPAYEQAMARQQDQAIRAVTEVSGYLRAPLTGTYMGRQFKVVIDLLGAPNQIHFRPYLDDYFLVLTHSNENHFNDIRQAYLHYLIDPLVTKYADDIDKKKAVGDYAQAAPFLAEHYKSDFLLLFTRSLIRAIEARVGSASKRQAAIQEAMGEGYILAGHFSEQLVAYEKQETAMRMYFPELIQTIDFKREERRLEGIQFSAQRREGKLINNPPPPQPDQSPAEKSLDAAEDLYKKQDWDKARETFARVLSETQQNPLQARAYYGLARIAALKKDPETAVQLFEKGLKLGPPPFERAWMLVYLGRLSVAAGEFTRAGEQFQQAIAVDGGSDKAREAARIGLAQIAQQNPK